MDYYFLGLLGAWGVLTICGSVNRIILLRKLNGVRNVSDAQTWDQMWRAWSLLAIEPIMSTFVAIAWLFWVTNLEDWTWLIPWFIQYTPIMIQLCILLFIVRIWVIGNGVRRARLALTVLSTRLVILSVPLFLVLFGINSKRESLDTSVVVCLLIAYVFRILFGIYQNRVTPNSVQFLRTQQIHQDIIDMRNRARNDDVTLGVTENARHESTTPLIDAGTQEDIVLIEDNELWDEQMALIERLKAEKVRIDAEAIGRAHDLV